MSHGHGHGIAAQPGSASGRHVRPLAAALGIGAAFMLLELAVGVLTSSLALISDAAHMLTDVVGVGMALAAILMARRTGQTATRTFGMYRAEVLAALANALLMFLVAAYVLVRAGMRAADPPEVPGLPVLVVGAAGMVANLVSFLLLRRGADESLNVRGAYLEVLADLLGSFGALLSGLVTLTTGWRYADPIVGVAIGLFVLPRAWALGRRALRILFQHAPDSVDTDAVTASLCRVGGVSEVHDLHVWTLTSGMDVASAHLGVRPGADTGSVLTSAQRVLRTEYGIDHATLQVEPPDAARNCTELTW